MKRTMRPLGALLVLTLSASSLAQEDLAEGFRNPPAVARPHTWWHWMNGNITKEGISADLEAMKQIGLGGAQIFNVSEGIPAGPVQFASAEWRQLVRHAATGAERLGLELCVHNCAGWSSSGGPWITPQYAMQMVVMSETRAKGPGRFSAILPQPETRRDFYRDIAVLAFPAPPDDSRRIKDIGPKAGYEARYGQQPDLSEFPADCIVRRDGILDLTGRMAGDGRLDWEVPAGEWIILRIGHTPTGKDNHPAPESGRGLECDKLSREALDVHWAGMMKPLIQDLGPLAGRTLNNCLIDSYEVGHQNWTPRFREAFRQRRGYDPLPFLPVLTGRVVDSGEVAERFLWDLRRTIADLFADNYYGYFSELCHADGLLASIEPYDGPFECLLAGGAADIPMGEFWVGSRQESNSCKLAASVAHTYGKRIVGAEAFTAAPAHGRWQNHPYTLKAVGDLMYCAGINRFIVHRYAHQPWLDRFPGMTMGQWGTHFERTVTWWEQGAEWIRYLTRCQYLLQQGLPVADVCYFAGEAAPNGAPHNPGLKDKGYDYDACNADVLLNRLAAEDGRLVLPDGMSYRVLVLPDTPFMTPPVLARLRELVRDGATVIGPRPERSPSLTDYPQCDVAVQRLAAEVWGDCDGTTVKEHVFGRGRVLWGRAPEEVLAAMGVGPDFEFRSASVRPRLAWIHRVVDGADLYFVSNERPWPVEVECTFRVSGKVPELWHADTGETATAPVWYERDGRTTVPISLDPAGSVFVVFRQPVGPEDHFVSLQPPQTAAGAPPAPQIEISKAVYEAVDGAGGADVTAKVAALVKAGETSIPADNATFGDPAYLHVKRLRVEYTVDGRPLTRSVEENGTLELLDSGDPSAMPQYRLVRSVRGKLELHAFQPGVYEFRTAAGRQKRAEVASVPNPVEIGGGWTLRFPPGWGAPASVQLDRLLSWTDHPDPGVRYFSGTAEYQKEFDIPEGVFGPDTALYLNLGRVHCLAEVTLNDANLGVWWKPPLAMDISSAARPGRNVLKVRVTNLWVNRLVGDEQHPEDCEWDGKVLKRWPPWLLEGRERPVPQRLTFTTWRHYTRDSAPLESGLLGPVRLQPAARISVE